MTQLTSFPERPRLTWAARPPFARPRPGGARRGAPGPDCPAAAPGAERTARSWRLRRARYRVGPFHLEWVDRDRGRPAVDPLPEQPLVVGDPAVGGLAPRRARRPDCDLSRQRHSRQPRPA